MRSKGLSVKSLVIENSSSLGTVALGDGVRVLAIREIANSGALSVAVNDFLLEFGAPDEIVVGLGPGSYTGIRVGVAMVIGLSTGLGCPAYGCPSVLAYCDAAYHVVGDARRGLVFLASVEENRLIRPPELYPADEFHLMLPQLRTRPIFAVGPVPGVADLPIVLPRADYLLMRRDWYECSLDPIYLKEPHITVPKGSPGTGFGSC
jgi:tRNA threonylcarbamoyladenosine biosynthesis protein TsaB